MDPPLVIIIKAWREDNGDFRATITASGDVLREAPTQSGTTEPERLLRMVESCVAQWDAEKRDGVVTDG